MRVQSSRSKNPRAFQNFVDMVHVISCLVIVALTVFLYINPERYILFFPLVFLISAGLNFITAIYKWRTAGHRKSQKAKAVFFILLGAALCILTVVSLVSVWG